MVIVTSKPLYFKISLLLQNFSYFLTVFQLRRRNPVIRLKTTFENGTQTPTFYRRLTSIINIEKSCRWDTYGREPSWTRYPYTY